MYHPRIPIPTLAPAHPLRETISLATEIQERALPTEPWRPSDMRGTEITIETKQSTGYYWVRLLHIIEIQIR